MYFLGFPINLAGLCVVLGAGAAASPSFLATSSNGLRLRFGAAPSPSFLATSSNGLGLRFRLPISLIGLCAPAIFARATPTVMATRAVVTNRFIGYSFAAPAALDLLRTEIGRLSSKSLAACPTAGNRLTLAASQVDSAVRSCRRRP